MRSLIATRVGAMAAETLAVEVSGSVIGVTSKGVFIRAEKYIIFLTEASYLSPFNIQVDGADDALETLTPGNPVRISSAQITIAPHITISMNTAEIWTPAPPQPLRSGFGGQCLALQHLLARVKQADPADKGYLYLAEPGQPGENDTRKATRQATSALMRSFLRHEKTGFMAAARVLTGSGSGLTPSGDDFLTGFFLYQVRLDQSRGYRRDHVYDYLQDAVAHARLSTTSISTNRLVAAGRGWLEEIFLEVIDHLFDPSIPLRENLVEILINFGHSSGVDTLVGIWYAARTALVETLQPKN